MPRFVILYHECPTGQPRPSHWDFMLEEGEVLRTWALPRPPDQSATMCAEGLADHRLEYLRYEGTIAPGRGSVTQWDKGTYGKRREGPAELVLVLAGAHLRGTVVLTRLEGTQNRWCFAFTGSRPATPD